MLGLKRRTTSADRETIIALRATHTAHRVASDVAYPELPLPANKEGEGIFGERRIVDYEMSPVVDYGAAPMSNTLRTLLVVFAVMIVIAIAYHIFSPRY